ncbi:coproporphyrinogen dehydrogenase HemZ [Vermiculatibacterium agrestimuris]|uniref:coproporphyrinogen dehydrogenase HemZ n=1 Tax=Vermiculatibacterium agrestimuris TaxID=2941519 RepID=UPI00203BCAC6|nr:coproporphyrinogen dehydrogenase HemZ [Vermiculatibacterium agrestimuris]
MRLWLTSDNVDWDAERYHYAAEQMMLTLFPGEKPEYPDDPPPQSLAKEKNAVVFTLHRGKKLTNMCALVFRANGWYNGVVRFPSEKLDEAPEEVYHTVQRALKQAFYNAGSALLGRDLPWGSLTGVRPTKLPTRALWAGATPKQAQKELEKTYHVSPLRAQLALDCAQHSVAAKSALRPEEVSVYVGIPFCPSRCVYCSFVSAAVDKCLPLVESFVEGLCRETEALGKALRDAGRSVRTVYVGGGTPTTLSPQQLESVFSAMEAHLPLDGCTEFTAEAGRPDTITPEKLAVLARHRVNRVSVNPQSMDDAVLAQMGRPHTGDDIRRAYAQVRAAGDFAVNMDLIAGLPGDGPEGFAASLEAVLDMAPENVTVHTLALKKGSRLMEEHKALPTGGAVEEMLDAAWTALRAAGYEPYYLYRQKYMSGSFENVGWTKPGFASLYNIAMMEELHTILALGGGGVTKLVWPGTGKLERVVNPKYPQEYLRDIDKICREKAALTPFLLEMKGD